MRSVTRLLLLMCLIFPFRASPARGDGGAVRLVEQRGEDRIAVFTSPDPLRSGPIDVSLLIQNAATGQAIDSVEAIVTLRSRTSPVVELRAPATTAAATNKLLRAALVDLPKPGWWDVEVDCRVEGRPARVSFAVEAGPPLPDWLTVWPWFAWPAGAVLIFAAHRRLVVRKRTALAAAVSARAVGPGQFR